MPFDRDDTTFQVVTNAEEQFSIWPTFKEVPEGWTAVGEPGTKQACLAYIEKHWLDLRPLSLRKQMEEDDAAGAREA